MPHFRTPFIIFILLEVLIIILSVLLYGISLDALQSITRFSGRLSLVVFSLIFLLKNTSKDNRTWISDKPYLLFALIHGIHLAELLFFVTLSGIQLIPIRVLGGFLAYVYVFLMPLFAILQFYEKISLKTFRRMEMGYAYYIWFIFFMAYLPRVLGKLPNTGGSYWEYVLLFCWVIFMLIARLLTSFKKISAAR